MVRRSFLFSIAALMLATPATAQRFSFQDAPQSRSERDHRRQNDRPRDTRDEGRSERTWRPQQPETHAPPTEQSTERAPPLERRRYQAQDQAQDQGQRPPDRPPDRPPERPREVPLTDILRNLRGQYGGQHLDAQRSGENYVIPWLSRDGRRMVVVVDAATGRVVSVR